MSDNKDEMILTRAHEIKAERKVSLIDAMILAEGELAPKEAVPSEITVTIPLKPRVAHWLFAQFQATATHSTEERLAAYLSLVLNKSRVSAIRASDDGPEIQEGGAVTMSREQFQRKAPRA